MSDAIGPGDWVECIDDSVSRKTGEPCPLRRGAVYFVLRLVHSAHPLDRADPVGVVLQGVQMPRWSLGFERTRLRPIYRPKSEIIEALKAPAPSEPVPA